MSCTHCDATQQRGRFCIGCGRRLPPSPTAQNPVRPAPPYEITDDMTQPVLRFRVTPRRPAPQEVVTV